MPFNMLLLFAMLYLVSNERNVEGHVGEIPREESPWVGIGKSSLKPYPSVGALNDMQNFFESLRTNLDYLETLPQEEREVLLGKAPSMDEGGNNSKEDAVSAYLHALIHHRPSYKIRNFVDSSEPASLRGTNRYDPNLLWTGLGRR